MNKHKVLLTMICLLFLTNSFAQNVGVPPYKYYNTEEYAAEESVYSIVADSTGIIYVANLGGILRYDGISWTKILLPDNQPAYWLEKDQHGNIYVAANGEFGMLKSTPSGDIYYQSFLPLVDEKYRNFQIVWEIAVDSFGVLFRSTKHLFRYANGEVKSIVRSHLKNNGGFDLVISVNDKSIARIYRKGLATVGKDSVHLLPHGEFFKNIKINDILPYEEGKLLIASRFNGLYIYSKEGVIPFDSEMSDYLVRNYIYDAKKLQNGDFAIGTMTAGLTIINSKGEEKFTFDINNGLGNKQILFVTEIDQDLWIGTKNGMFQVAHQASYSTLGEESGISGQIKSLYKSGDNVYAATGKGVYKSAYSGDKIQFEKLSDITIASCLCVFEVKGELLVGCLEGVFSYSSGNPIEVASFSPRKVLRTSNSDIFIASEYNTGLYLFKIENGRKGYSAIKGIKRKVTELHQFGHNTYLAKTVDNILNEVKVNPETFEGEIVSQIDLIDDYQVIVQGDKFYLVNKDGYHIINDENKIELKGKLSFQHQLKKVIRVFTKRKKHHYIVYEDNLGNIFCQEFINHTQKILVSSSRYYYLPFRPTTILENLDNGEIWIGGNPGIYVFKVNDETIKSNKKTVLIRQINIGNDSTILHRQNNQYNFTHDLLNLKFTFVPTTSLNAGKTLYQYRMGNENWSGWTEDRYVNFNKLRPGNYTFQVRSSSPYYGVGKADSVTFIIAKPWYQTYWAYSLYFLLLLFLIYSIYKIRVRTLLKKQGELSKMVLQVTAQLSKSNASLQLKTKKLEELDLFKSKLFANVSHDLRTPLTLLTGRIHQLKGDKDTFFSSSAELTLERLEKDNKQLISFADEIRELIILDEGKLKLNYQSVFVNKYFKTLVFLFSSFAEVKQIDLSFKSELDDLRSSHLDTVYVQKVIYNLLSNAFKHTKAGDEISLVIEEINNGFTILVTDTGIGMSTDNQKRIFERYFQIERSEGIKEGFGIGLSLVKEVVEHHGGFVNVTSELGVGSSFQCYFPFNLEKPISSEINESTYTEYISNQLFEKENNEPSDTRQDIPFNFKKERETILVVDDHNAIRTYIAEIIGDGYNVLEANNGKAALKTLKEYKVNLIITDLMMPWMNGFELIDFLKDDERFEKIPIMVVSARVNHEATTQVLQKGVNNVLSKPFDPNELRLRLKNLISNKSTASDLKIDDTISMKQSVLAKLNEYLIQNMKKSKISASEIADELLTSERNLYRMIKELTGLTPLEYRKELKFKYAKEMLISKRGISTKEVALSIGISNVTYFKKQFQEKFGKDPGEYLN